MPVAERVVAGLSTIVPGVQRAPTPSVSHACGTWKPRLGPAVWAGRPTVREAESLGGNRMAREANAGTPKGDGKDVTSSGRLLVV
jgi:hypothetical protein